MKIRIFADFDFSNFGKKTLDCDNQKLNLAHHVIGKGDSGRINRHKMRGELTIVARAGGAFAATSRRLLFETCTTLNAVAAAAAAAGRWARNVWQRRQAAGRRRDRFLARQRDERFLNGF